MRFSVFVLAAIMLQSTLIFAQDKLVVAHRGASGYLPEHTMEAKVLAFAMGADYIEQDVVMTADDVLIVFHDLTLERMSDVELQFPDRVREDGSWYVIDFTLAEIRSLNVTEGTVVSKGEEQAIYPERFPAWRSAFKIHTFAEELELLQGLMRSTGRIAGIYPEIKSPWFHRQAGKDISLALLTVLQNYGYSSVTDNIYLQTFDYHELVRVHDELMPALDMELKLVQLIADNSWQETFTLTEQNELLAYDYEWMHSEAGLEQLSAYAVGVGPAYDMLVNVDKATGAWSSNEFTQWAHAAGLQVHPFTFRKDSLPENMLSFDDLLEMFLIDMQVDGVFTDFPDLARKFIDVNISNNIFAPSR